MFVEALRYEVITLITLGNTCLSVLCDAPSLGVTNRVFYPVRGWRKQQTVQTKVGAIAMDVISGF